MKKVLLRWVTLIVPLAVIICMTSAIAFADNEAAEIEGGQKYATLQEALDAVTNGQTVRLLKDVTENVVFGAADVDDRKITLDLAGHGITGKPDGGSVILIRNGRLTLADSASDQGTHKYKFNDDGLAVLDDDGQYSFTGGYITGGTGTPNQGVYENRNRGGGIYCIESQTVMTEAGMVYYPGGYFDMTGGTIIGNQAEDGGGFWWAKDGEDDEYGFTISGGAFIGNIALTGGGIYTQYCVSTVSNVLFYRNKAYGEEENNDGFGGGLFFYGNGGENMTFTNVKFIENTASVGGGGLLYDSDASEISMTDCTFDKNKSKEGGGAYFINTELPLVNTVFQNNEAEKGGAIYNSSGTIRFKDSECVIKDNTAEYGGGIYSRSGKYFMNSGTIAGNTAEKAGGGVYCEEYDTITPMGDPVITGNTSGDGVADNLYLNKKCYVATYEYWYYNEQTDEWEKELMVPSMTTGASIGITLNTEEGDGLFTNIGNEDLVASILQYFHADDSERLLVKQGDLSGADTDELYLVTKLIPMEGPAYISKDGKKVTGDTEIKAGDVLQANAEKGTRLSYTWYYADENGDPVGEPLATGRNYTVKPVDIDEKLVAVVSQEDKDDLTTEETPTIKGLWVIHNLKELEEFQTNVNGGYDYADAKVRLANDIDMSGKYGPDGESWTPIGTGTPFRGAFDGDGHKITGIYVDSSEDSSYNSKAGLFGQAVSASFKDLTVSGEVTGASYTGLMLANGQGVTIENCDVEGPSKVTSTSGMYTGGVAGYLTYRYLGSDDDGNAIYDYPSLVGCDVDADVTGSRNVGGVAGYFYYGAQISDCNNSGTVTAYSEGGGATVGGIVGYASSSKQTGAEMINCKNTGDVKTVVDVPNNSNTNINMGGIAGQYNYNMINCYNEGDVEAEKINTKYGTVKIGGVVGAYNSGNMEHCYNSGSVKNAHTDREVKIGGLIGALDGNDSNSIKNNYNSGDVTIDSDFLSNNYSQSAAGGLIGSLGGNNTKATIENCHSFGTVAKEGDTTTEYIHGAVGYYRSSNFTVNNCYYNEASPEDTKAEDLSDDEFKVQQTFTDAGWDFSNIWEMSDKHPVFKADSIRPAAKDLTYNGSGQELVSVGNVPDGVEMFYALGDDDQTAPGDDKYSDTIPEGTTAGTYYVWYKVVKEGVVVDSGCVPVEISKKALTITADSGSKTYDGTALTKKTYTFSTLASGDTISEITITGSQTDAGSSDNTVSAVKIVNSEQKEVTDSYEVSFEKGTLTVVGRVCYVKQKTDGTWETADEADKEARTGDGTSYVITKAYDNYAANAWSKEYKADEADRTAAYPGSAIQLGGNINELYIYYALDQYDLKFYEDTAGTIVWKTEKVYYGASLSSYGSETLPEKENYTFAGWATEKDIVVDSYMTKDGKLNPELEGKVVDWTQTMSAEMSVYPIWIHDRLNVQIKLGDDEANPATIDKAQSLDFTVNLDEKVVMRYLINAARPGYELAGWFTQSGVLWNGENWKDLPYAEEGWVETAGWGVTPEYCDRDASGKPDKKTNTVRRFSYYTVTLTAQWTPVPTTAKFDKGEYGADTPADITNVKLGDTITLPEMTSTDTSKVFTGWLDKNNKLHAAKEAFTFTDWSLADDDHNIKFTAQYQEKPDISITFDTDGGTPVETIVVEESSYTIQESPETTKTGYTFNGWYNGTDKVTFPETFSTDTTLTAHWTVNQYKITFDSRGGTQISPKTQDYGTAITAPADPTMDHYEFVGWYPVLPQTMPAVDLTVVANWKAIEYTMTFTVDGQPYDTIKDIYGAIVTPPKDPAKEGYTFAGWKDATDKIVTIPSYMTDKNPVYTAAWKKDQAKPGDPKASAVDASTIKVNSPVNGQTYIIVPTGTTPTDSDWAGEVAPTSEEVTFKGLRPNTTYDVYTRLPGSGTMMPSEPAGPATVTTPKAEQNAPDAPKAEAVSESSIKVDPVEDGEEYIIKKKGVPPTDLDWDLAKSATEEDPNVIFDGLDPDTEYDIYARMKETPTQKPSPASLAGSATTQKQKNIVVVTMEDWVYGEKASEPSYKATDGEPVFTYSDKKDGVYTDVKPSDAGTWFVKATVAEHDTYAKGEAVASFTIHKTGASAPLVTEVQRRYDGTTKPLVDVSGTPVGGTLMFALGPDTGEEPEPEDYREGEIPEGKDRGTYYVWYYVAGNENHNDSEPEFVKSKILDKVEPGKPSPIGTDETFFNKNDGTISNITTDMEYSFETDPDDYMPIEGSEMTDLAPGVYYIRFKETDTQLPSKPAIVIIKEGSYGTVTFYSEKGVAVSEMDLVKYGDKLEKPADPSKTGYKFEGWFKDEDCTEAWDFDKDTITERRTKIYAKWTEVTLPKAVATAPELNDLTYNGKDQELVSAGPATDGVMYYRVDGGKWMTEIPLGKEAGKYTVSWYLKPNDGFTSDSSAADPAGSGVVTIKKKEVKLTWAKTDEWDYDGNDHVPGVSVDTEVEGETLVATVAGAASAPGSHTAKVTKVSGPTMDNYRLPAETTKEFTINKAALTPVVTMSGWTYGDKPATPSIEGNAGGGNVTYYYKPKDAPDTAYSDEKPVDAGVYTVKAVIAATAGYKESSASADFTIEQKTADITWENIAFVYDGKSHAPQAWVSNLEKGDKVDVKVTGAQTDASKTPYTASASELTGADAANYKLPKEAEQSFTIAKGTLEPQVTITGWTYQGASDKPVNAPVVEGNEGGGAVEYTYAAAGSDKFGSYKDVVNGQAGTYVVKASIAETEDGYAAAEATSEFTIDQRTADITWEDIAFVYDGESHAPNALVSNLAKGDEVVVVVEGEQTLPSRTPYTAAASELAGPDAANYKLPRRAVQSFTIAKGTIEPQVTMTGWTYQGASDEPVNAPVVKGNEGGGAVEYTYAAIGSEKFGSYKDVVNGQAGTYVVKAAIAATPGYRESSATSEFTITQKTADITWENVAFAYDGESHAPYAWVSNAEKGDVVDVVVEGAEIKASKTPYTAEATALAGPDAANYKLPDSVTQSFTIAKGRLEPQVTMTGWTYQGASDKPVNAPVVEGNEGGGAVVYTYAVVGSDKFGSYEEIVNGQAGTYVVKALIAETEEGYAAAEATSTFRIEPKTASLIWTGVSLTYNGEPQAPKAVVANLVGDDECEVAVEGAKKDAGEYVAKAEVLSNRNYVLPETAAQTFVIAKANIDYDSEGYTGVRDEDHHGITVAVTAPQNAVVKYGTSKGTYDLTESPSYKEEGTYTVYYQITADSYNTVTGKEQVVITAKYKPEDDPADYVDYDDLTEEEKQTADKLAEAYGTDKDTAAKLLRTGEELGIPLDTMLLTTEKLASLTSDKDPAGTSFSKLRARAIKRGKTTMVLQWQKQTGADGYLIYTNKCGKNNKLKLKKVVKKNSTVKWSRKKLKKSTYYKYMVVAYKNVNGERLPIAASRIVHCTTKSKKSTIAKGVKVNKTSVSLSAGKTFTIKAKEIKAEKGKKISKHRGMNYESSKPEIASVNLTSGKVKANQKGTAYIYAYAQDGAYKKIKVTVK